MILNDIPPSSIVIVAPLNWGLGHAVRCIPIINDLMINGHKVVLASDGAALSILKKEFPDLFIYNLPSPEIRYPYRSMILNVMTQIWKLFQHIKIDKVNAQRIVNETKANVIISDNRFGFRDDRCINLYMTHQLDIQHPNPFVKYMANRWHHRIIQSFDLCLVPDYADEDISLGGNLSHSFHKNLNIKYINPITTIIPSDVVKDIDVLIVLSGPEPQRSLWEELLDKSIQLLSQKQLIIVRGSFNKSIISPKPNITIYDVSDRATLQSLYNRSKILITRSGYTTIMDIARLNLTTIFVPTPGQSEQEYLAHLLSSRHPERYRLFDQNQVDKLLLSIAAN